MSVYTPRHSGWINVRAFVLIGLVFLSTAVLATFFFFHNRAYTEQHVKNMLKNYAAVSAMQFNGKDFSHIQGQDDMNTPMFKETVKNLYEIKHRLPEVVYAYIMRKTDDPNILEFIADADLYDHMHPVDGNENGIIDPEEELSYPGMKYDISDFPVMRDQAFVEPAADEEFTTDQWGSFISAYAPIFDAKGNAIAIIGLDMDASDFLTMSTSIFRPAVFLLVILLALFLSSYVAVLFSRRRLEITRELDLERSALVNLALHQLGAPLAIFRWWVEILNDRKEKEQDDEFSEICEQLSSGVKRMSEVMIALEEANQMEHSELHGSDDPCYVSIVAKDVIAELTPKAQEKDITLTTDLHDHDISMYLDRKVVTAILHELMSNAIDFTKRGSVTIRSAIVKGGIEIAVSDTGVGIPRDDMPRIFERFVRGSNAQKMKPIGNGVGLYIIKEIVEKAKGKIWIESKEGKGTTVSIVLPVKDR